MVDYASSASSAKDNLFTFSNVKMKWGGNTTPPNSLQMAKASNAFHIEVADGDSGGIAIDNDGTTIYGAGDNGYVFRVVDEDVAESVGFDGATIFEVLQDSGVAVRRGGLSVAGTITGDEFKFVNDKFGGSGDSAGMRLISRGSESMSLELYTANDADDIINFVTPDTTNGVKANGNTIIHAGNISSYANKWYDGWVGSPGYDANTIVASKSGFSYSNNCPNTGCLVHFDAGGYGLQLSSLYYSGGGSIEDPNTEIGKISDYIQKTSELVKYCRELLRGQEEEIAKLNEQ